VQTTSNGFAQMRDMLTCLCRKQRAFLCQSCPAMPQPSVSPVVSASYTAGVRDLAMGRFRLPPSLPRDAQPEFSGAVWAFHVPPLGLSYRPAIADGLGAKTPDAHCSLGVHRAHGGAKVDWDSARMPWVRRGPLNC
jgi:hypothetical protein